MTPEMAAGMSLRVATTNESSGVTLWVSGRLVGPWIAELARAFESAAEAPGVPVVDISDMSFAAAEGVAVLRGFIRRGALVRGCPAYLMEQLHGEVTP
jgi:hypothetical protein